MKTIAITGGSGFVGAALTKLLVGKDYKVVVLTRSAPKTRRESNIIESQWDSKTGICDKQMLGGIDAVVNLAGAGIVDKRWTTQRKKEIAESRIKGTDFLVEKLRQYAPKCKTMISASAIGYYGPDKPGQGPFTETDTPADDFLAVTCKQWEQSAQKASDFLRLVILRFGVVLGKESGAFPEFERPTRFGVVPILGSGRQVISWIALGDLVRLIEFALENENLTGICNAVAPNPVTNKQLMQTIASVKGGIKIPLPVPMFLLKMALGEMSEELLKSATVSAGKALQSGFVFDYPGIAAMVKAILGKG